VFILYTVTGGRVSQIKYDPFQGQLLTGNATGAINAGHNWWGQITGVDDLIIQSVPGTVNYETMEIDYITSAGASYTNVDPQFTLLTPDSMMVNPANATLSWIDMDIDDDALISLYFDDGLDETGTLIVEGISEDNSSDNYLWDFAGVPFALYNIYGVIDDGVNPPLVSYATGQIMVGPVSVSAPDDAHGVAGAQVTIPINVANTYDYFEIISFQFIVNFDNLLLTANSVESTGTLTDDWTVDSNMLIPGQITVNGFSTDTLSTGGTLVELVFDVDGGGLDYENCIINISSFEFNDGDVDLVIDDGLFTVLNEYTISGEIDYYSNDEPIEATYLLLTGSEEDSTNTNVVGTYTFPVHIAGNYELTPASEQEIPELVVTPYDASLVARYALGLETFNNNQIIAGDVNNNLETTVYDAALIAQYSIGLIDEFDAGIWKFTPNTYSFELTGSNEVADYEAIAIGDPSGNWGVVTDEINENIILEIVSTNRDDEEFLILNAYFSDPFISTYTEVGFSTEFVEFSEIIESESISNFQVMWQETDNTIVLGAYGVDYTQTSEAVFSLEFAVLDDIINVNDVINCEFLLFDEQEGNMIINTESHNILVPMKFDLEQNYPNPFNPETKISFSLPMEIDTKIEVYNVKGQRVQVLVNEKLGKGIHSIIWKADDFASGVYFYRIEAGDFTDSKKMILIK
jgi:Secretion system C-terminal sorting domain/Cohesin domain